MPDFGTRQPEFCQIRWVKIMDLQLTSKIPLSSSSAQVCFSSTVEKEYYLYEK